MSDEVVKAGLAALAGIALAMLNGWITTRAGSDDEVRERRLTAYPALWALTSAASFFPPQPVTRATLEHVQGALRTWYFGTGGMFLSTRAQKRYLDVQRLVVRLLAGGDPTPDATLDDWAYAALAETFSSLRTALTYDLDTRRRISLLSTIERVLWHRRASGKAEACISDAQRNPAFSRP